VAAGARQTGKRMLVSRLFGAASSSNGAIHKALAPASIPLTPSFQWSEECPKSA